MTARKAQPTVQPIAAREMSAGMTETQRVAAWEFLGKVPLRVRFPREETQ